MIKNARPSTSPKFSRSGQKTPGITLLAQNDKSRGPMGFGTATGSFAIQLDLEELVELNHPEYYPTGGLIKKGPGFARDSKRPARVLELVRSFFFPLAATINIELGHGAGAARFLKARFSWGMETGVAGAGATSVSRSQIGQFSVKDPSSDVGVTAYIFEGAIADFLINHVFDRTSSSDIDNLFAACIAHELGHNLGLDHADSPGDLMFRYVEHPADAQKLWLTEAMAGKLRFKGWQIASMQRLLSWP